MRTDPHIPAAPTAGPGRRLFFLQLLLSLFLVLLLTQHAAGRQQAARHVSSCEKGRPGFPVVVPRLPQSNASVWFDVVSYSIGLRVAADRPYLDGSVTIRGIARQDHPQFVTFDLRNGMTVDSVFVDGIGAAFSRGPDIVIVGLNGDIVSGDQRAVRIRYHGSPDPSGLGSFVATTHPGGPWIWSLSEPYGARDWWPCKDTPSDKADSADIAVTVDSSLSVASEGLLLSVHPNGDGTSTWRWIERYPIAPYLISIAISNYSLFTDWYHFAPDDSLLIASYVLPESSASARACIPPLFEAMRIFSSAFGRYPFSAEKYGHAQAGGFGMEHQTMTSLPSFDTETVVHELAHQWFGDMITCRSWSDIWLNEGFATFATAFYEERTAGAGAYRSFMDYHLRRAKTATGTVVTRDTADARSLFNGARTYSKGACVLHMLRHVIGDSLFFQALYEYANDPALKYSTAVTADFQRVCERVSGEALSWFFTQWLYGEGFPSYQYSWESTDSAGMSVVRLVLEQTTGTLTPPLFRMPLDVRIAGGGRDSLLTIMNSSSPQEFHFILPFPPASIAVDPEHWVLANVSRRIALPLPGAFALHRNFPNPFNSSTRILYDIPRRAAIDLSIFDLAGRKITTLFHGEQFPGRYDQIWAADGMASGIYFCRLATDGGALVSPMILLK